MGFKKDDAGGLLWDKSTAGERWGKKANRPDFVEAAEMVIERGSIEMVWDTLASPATRPADLNDDEERLIVRCALRRGADLGRLDANMVGVLLRLIGGADRLKTENKDMLLRRGIRAEIQARPHITLGQLRLQFPDVARSTLQMIRDDVLSND
jgi:hypothetical protein